MKFITQFLYPKILRFFINWMVYYGAPAQFSLDVKNYINRKFSNKLIGRAKPDEFPSGSPDFTPMDFILWD